jgi:hypothetical protein
MKKQIALFALVAAALIAAPAVASAQDAKPEKKQKQEAGEVSKNPRGLPLHGKVAAVDAAAGTVTVGKTTVTITSETKIKKQGQPATIADITVGETITGHYKKAEDGKLNATVINIGGKGEKTPKREKAAKDAAGEKTKQD